MKPGNVVLIRFPQTDLLIGKLRPALVVAIAPGRHADLLLALISSRTYQAVPRFDHLIRVRRPAHSFEGGCIERWQLQRATFRYCDQLRSTGRRFLLKHGGDFEEVINDIDYS